jgi:hypothetical protein
MGAPLLRHIRCLLPGRFSAGTYSSYDANFYHVEAWGFAVVRLERGAPLTVLGRDSIRAVVTLDSPIQFRHQL